MNENINNIVEEYLPFIRISVYNISDKEKEGYLEDFIQDVCLILLEKQSQVFQLYKDNKLKFFIIRIILNNLKSQNSPFYYTYRKKLPYVEPDINEENI